MSHSLFVFLSVFPFVGLVPESSR